VEREILKDESLENLKLIKQMDTMAIINKADKICKKKEALLIKTMLIMISMILISFNLSIIYLCGFKWILIIDALIIWISPIFLFSFMKKRYI
jgi:hypothetical protein